MNKWCVRYVGFKSRAFFIIVLFCYNIWSFANTKVDDIVILKFTSEKKIKFLQNIEENLTSLLVEKFLLTGKYNVIVPLPQELNEIHKKMVLSFGKNIKPVTGEYLIEIGKYYKAKIVILPEIKKFNIRNLSILNPKLGGENIYVVDIEFHITVVDPEFISATHFMVSSESVGKTEAEFKTLITHGGGWYEEMLTYKEYKELPKMKFGSYEFRTSKLGQKLNSMLNQIVLNVEKFSMKKENVEYYQ